MKEIKVFIDGVEYEATPRDKTKEQYNTLVVDEYTAFVWNKFDSDISLKIVLDNHKRWVVREDAKKIADFLASHGVVPTGFVKE